MKSKHIKDFTTVYANTSKQLIGIYKDHYLDIARESKCGDKWYIMCQHPEGAYIYDGYFKGTFGKAMEDVIANINTSK